MNLVFVGYFKLPDKTAAAQLIRGVAKIAKDAGNTVTIIDYITGMQASKISVEQSELDGISVVKIAFPNSVRGHVAKRFNYSVMRQFITDGSAVLCYNFSSAIMAQVMSDRKVNIMSVPVITEWYSAGELKGIVSFFKCMVKKIDIEVRMRILAPKSDGMIVCSTYLRDFYQRYCPILVIPTVVDYSKQKWTQSTLQYDSSVVNFVYAGSLGDKKDKLYEIMKILENASQGKPYVVRVMGLTKEQFVSKYSAQQDVEKFANKAEHCFMGRLPHEECVKVILSSDYSILYRESNRVANAGFPTKFGESMACGVPQIVTDTSDLSQYIEDGKNGFIIDFDVDKASKQLEKIFGFSREEIEEQKAYTKKLRLFDSDKYIEMVRDFFESIK